MAVALRNHTDKIDNKLTPTEILTTLFSCDSVDQLQDKLIILDGLDELSVLISGFDGQSFLSKLSQLDYGFHVLVTSREADSYFRLPNDKAGLKTAHLVWAEKQINGWLEIYKGKKPNKEKWCKTFKGQLKPNDPRCAIFCVPIILYICGTSETDLKNHSSIGSIYRDAFRKILLRNYIQGQHNTYELREADKEAALIAWQYTKELAYQMFLLNTLDLVDDDELEERHAIGFRNAKKRTADILKEEYNIINPDLELKKELAICPFAKENGTGGITFAHKTVYEYFTAVKLYEDYFARFDTAYFKTNNEATAAKEVMESFIEAFRYEAISHEIFNHICEMNEAPLLSKLGYCKSTGLNYTKYENAFTFAMQKHMYAIIGMKPAVKEYLYASFSKLERKYTNWHSKSLEIQMNTSYANFTWFLTIHGFTNEKRIQECMLIGSLLYNSLIAACLERWHFENADLQYYHLEKANLFDAHLEQTNFKGAYLQEAHLQEAHLKDAIFKDANLFKANLENSDLTHANFTYANLKRVQMNMANLTNANLKEASLIFANLTRATLTCANFEGSNMKGAHLNKAKLKSANLQNANLEGAFFEYADLRKAVLKGSILIDADFIKANLSDADLSYTDLSDANMSGTDLRLTNLTGAIMKSAKYCNDPLLETIFPTDFDPEEHGMIEVDIDGNPVKDQ